MATDADKAETLRKWFTDAYDEAIIETYDTDEETVPDDIQPVFIFTIDENSSVQKERTIYRRPSEWSNEFTFNIINNKRIIAKVMAEDREHALKIALDARGKMLAEKFGL